MVQRMDAPEAETVAKQIVDDIKNRKGIGDEWEAMGYDLKKEIIEKWRDIILGETK